MPALPEVADQRAETACGQLAHGEPGMAAPSATLHGAIDNAIATASQTWRNIDRFNVIEARGHIVDGKGSLPRASEARVPL
jgi:hypothetical protein